MIFLLSTFTIAVVLLDVFLILFWRKQDKESETKEFPKISILVAARNEEYNIERCLKSLLDLDYPKDKFEILVGDDDSKDNTFQKADEILKEHSAYKVIKINDSLGELKGKANVLAQLAHVANGDYLFVTDADMQLPTTWAKRMLSTIKNGYALVTGVTLVEKDYFQSIDWLFALGMVKVLDNIGYPVTTMGNNMAISRAAYDELGGYESIPFSVTEDLSLFKAVNEKGLKSAQLYDQKVLGWTLPIPTFSQLLQQRKRWLTGAVQLPWPIVSLLFFQALYFPVILLLFVFSGPLAMIYLGLKVFVQTIFLWILKRRLKVDYSLFQLLTFEVYSYVLSVSTIIFYLLPVPVQWKGRKY